MPEEIKKRKNKPRSEWSEERRKHHNELAKTYRKTVSCLVANDIHAKFKECLEKNGDSMNQVVKKCVMDYIAKTEQEEQKENNE